MKKPVVDYGSFRLSRWREAEYIHLQLLWGWVVYFILFFLTEVGISPEECYLVYSPLDDRIPFCELFLIPYVLWYGLLVFSLVYFGLFHIDSFKKFSVFIMIVQAVSICCYILFPTRQDLRPVFFPRDNFLTRCIGFLYKIDTNTGVCPSFHVGGAIAIAVVWAKTPEVKKGWKWLLSGMAVLICLSTVFIKQHSVIDFFAALPGCALAQRLVYGKKSLRR